MPDPVGSTSDEGILIGVPCPMCALDMETYPQVDGLLVCYLCGLLWNPWVNKARALRRG